LEASRIRLKTVVEGFVDCVEATAKLLSDPELEPEMRGQMSATYALCLMSVGRAKEADEIARRSRLGAPLRDGTHRYRLGSACIVGLDAGEDWADLEAYSADLLRDAIRVSDHEAAGFAAFTLGSLEIQGGRYRAADRWLAEAEAQFERHDAFDVTCWLRALQVEIAYFSGDPERAQTTLESVRERLTKRPPGYVQRSYVARAEGWGACALSAADGAKRFMDEAARTRDANVRSRALYDAMRAGARPASVAPALAELAEQCDSRLIAARAAHATARAAGDGHALLAAGDQLAALGAQAAAMDAAVDAARQFIAGGRTDSARSAAAVARQRHAADQGAEFPLIDGLDGAAVELTSREAQIAVLAGRGLSNQQIADQLVLSVRTVETYVYRAMQKRGVDHRREL
jgi:DNA-binding NarL/FixJ family response regulator